MLKESVLRTSETGIAEQSLKMMPYEGIKPYIYRHTK